MNKPKTIGVILSGCGNIDGAEIREAVFTLLALDRLGANVRIMAPNIEQYHVVNFLSKEESAERRNVLQESARIARGEIEEISDVDPLELDGLIIPGGAGVAKNLCSFYFDGAKATIEDETENFLLKYKELNRPLGAICIAPALVALLYGDLKVKVTIGNDEETAKQIEKTGAKHVITDVRDICVDIDNKVITTPAYMYENAKLHEINEGIEKCVNAVYEMS